MIGYVYIVRRDSNVNYGETNYSLSFIMQKIGGKTFDEQRVYAEINCAS